MLIGLSGTPGTGKTSVSKLLEKNRGWKIIYLNDLIKEEHLYTEVDEKRDAVIADMELIRERLAGVLEGEKGQDGEKEKVNGEEKADRNEDITIIESHLAHYITDIVIVLRASPPELKKRLEKRGYSEEKIRENIEAEALDVILVESSEWCEKIFEINTTGKSIEKIEQDIEKIIDYILSGEEEELAEFKPGSIDWIDLVP